MKKKLEDYLENNTHDCTLQACVDKETFSRFGLLAKDHGVSVSKMLGIVIKIFMREHGRKEWKEI